MGEGRVAAEVPAASARVFLGRCGRLHGGGTEPRKGRAALLGRRGRGRGACICGGGRVRTFVESSKAVMREHSSAWAPSEAKRCMTRTVVEPVCSDGLRQSDPCIDEENGFEKREKRQSTAALLGRGG